MSKYYDNVSLYKIPFILNEMMTVSILTLTASDIYIYILIISTICLIKTIVI